jgi:hypothetical protein
MFTLEAISLICESLDVFALNSFLQVIDLEKELEGEKANLTPT